MGLDCSHDAFHGAYSAFNRLRQAVCKAIGGSYPPHWIYSPKGEILYFFSGMPATREDLDPDLFYWDDEGDYNPDSHPGLFEFLRHSDCDGEISPTMADKVAGDLEEILPRVKDLGWESAGHIKARGGFVEVLRKFIDGCRRASQSEEPIIFH